MQTIGELFNQWADESAFARDVGIEMPTFPEYVRLVWQKELDDQALDEAIRDAVALNEALPPVEQHMTEDELLRAAEANDPKDAYARPTFIAPRPLRRDPARWPRNRAAARPRERRSAGRRSLTRAGPSDDPDPEPDPSRGLPRPLTAILCGILLVWRWVR